MASNSRTADSLQRLDINSWKDGEVSSFYAARVPNSGLKIAQDTVVEQNGTLSDRGSFLRDEIDELPFPLLGNVYVYKLADSSENLICMLDDGDNGIVYTLDGTNWVAHSEVLFSRLHSVDFTQSTAKVVIWNDHDPFSYFDIALGSVEQFAAVDDPVSPLTAVKTGLATTGFTIYYKFSYTGNGGETNLSPAYSNTLGLLRENWASTDYFTLTRPAAPDPDTIDWALWMVMVPTGSGTPTAEDYELIKENIPLATTVIVDNGKLVADTVRSAPEENTTAGIIAHYGSNINGRLWAIHDHTVYWGGDTDSELVFGGAKGSGFHPIDQYGIEVPMSVKLGRDNSGTTCINVLTASTAGRGSIFDVYPNTINVAGVTIAGYEFKQREGSDGTNAPYSVIHTNNNLHYLSLLGFKSTGVKPNVTGIQSTDIVSNAIKDKVQLLTQNDLNTTYVAAYDEKVLWTVAYGSETNNQIWVYDILHGGIWSRWNVQADAIFTWVKSGSSSAKLYIVRGQRVLYYQPNSIAHQDDSETFTSLAESGVIGFKEDNREWVYLLQVLFVLLRPLGKVHFSITAHTKRGDITKERVHDFGGVSSDIGWNSLTVDDVFTGAHNAKVHNEIYGTFTFIIPKEWLEVAFRYRKMTQYFTYKVWVEDRNSAFMLSQVVPEFTEIGMGPDMLTRTDSIRV